MKPAVVNQETRMPFFWYLLTCNQDGKLVLEGEALVSPPKPPKQ